MLTLIEAQELTEQIRVDQDAVDDLIIAAFKGQAHQALGYKTWIEYATENFPKFKQSPAERLESVLKMRDAGMSTRSVGAALGVDHTTIMEDLHTDVSHKTGGNPPEGAEVPSPKTPKARKPAVSARATSNKQTPKMVQAYAQIVTDHPDWPVKHITEHLIKTIPSLTKDDQKFTNRDVLRLKMWHEAPPEFREAFFDGRISSVVGEKILTGTVAMYMKLPDKLNLLQKVLDGLIPKGAEELTRAVAEVMSTGGRVKDMWLDPELKMSYEDLLVAKTDRKAEAANNKQKSRDDLRQIRAELKLDYGIKCAKWINGLGAQLDLVEDELPAIMAIRFEAEKMAEILRHISTRMWDLAETIDNGGVKPEAKTGMTDYTTIDADEDWDNHDPANRSSNGWAGTIIDG